MPTDLDYFKERDLNTDLRYFSQKLPSHLQNMFNSSLIGLLFTTTQLATIYGEKLSLLFGSISFPLRGYRGPHPSGQCKDSAYLGEVYGLQEVRFQWSYNASLLTILTTGRTLKHYNNWFSLYFDSKTGQCLSDNKIKAATKLNEIGHELFKTGKFTEAKEYFSNAYSHSSDPSHHRNIRQAEEAVNSQALNNQADELAKEGDDLLSQGRYQDASDKFRKACNTCTDNYIKKASFKRKMDEAISAVNNNKKACELGSTGNSFLNQGEYEEAYEQYNQALSICSKDYCQRKTFINLRANAEMLIKKRGATKISIFTSKKSKGLRPTDSTNRTRLINWINLANSIFKVSQTGLNLLGSFLLACYNTLKVLYNKSDRFYKLSMTGLQLITLLLLVCYNVLTTLYSRSSWFYSRAKIGLKLFRWIFIAGYEVFKVVNRICSRYYMRYLSSGVNRYTTNLASYLSNEAGHAVQKCKDLSLSFGSLLLTCTNAPSTMYQALKKWKEKANINKKSEYLNSKGQDYFTRGLYKKAAKSFHLAYKTCSSDYHKKASFLSNRDNALTEFNNNNQAENLAKEGENLQSQGRYKEAYNKFEEAYNICSCGYDNEEAFRDKMDNVINEWAKDLYEEGNKFFNKGKYEKALMKYQDALDKASNEQDKHEYSLCKNETSSIIHAISMIETLWNEAWKAEENEQEDAQDKFEDIISKLISLPDICEKIEKLRQYKSLTLLKIEGNQLFNQGLGSQQEGIKLLQEANILKQEQNYEAAQITFTQARDKFLNARDKFQDGSDSDQRFTDCVAFVNNEIYQVETSLKRIKECRMECNINFNVNNNCLGNTKVENNVYSLIST